MFPICETQPRYKSGAAKPLDVKGGVTDQALRIIAGVQPYNAPNWLDHPLLGVRRLANINKHQCVLTGTKEISDVILTHPGIQLARYAVTLGEVRDDFADLTFTLTGSPALPEPGATAYIFVEHAENQPVAPIRSLTYAAQFIREAVVGRIERTCI